MDMARPGIVDHCDHDMLYNLEMVQRLWCRLKRWALLTEMLGVLTMTAGQVARPADFHAPLSSSACQRDADCQAGYSCFVQQGPVAKGVCIPKVYAASDADDEECLYRATCAAAAALRRVCRECFLFPILSCDGIPPTNTMWYQKRWRRFARGCLRPSPEQIEASKMPRATKRRPPKAPIEHQQAPDFGVHVNGWTVNVPAFWAGPEQTDWSTLHQREDRLQRTLAQLPQFNPACPTVILTAKPGSGTATVASGICGAFRNPDPSKTPPSVTYSSAPN